MDKAVIKAVVFDCDGVMFDTALANRKFYNDLLDGFSKPPLDDEQFINIHMMTVTAAVEYLFPEMDDHQPVYNMIKSIGYANNPHHGDHGINRQRGKPVKPEP